MINDPILIKKEAIKFFKDRGQMEDRREDVKEVLESIQESITDEQNARLNAVVSKEEVKNALWGLGKDKSPGPNGFTGSFFRLI